jgi:CRP/FNR family cyclic AMP-dependent transcriptional regulator
MAVELFSKTLLEEYHAVSVELEKGAMLFQQGEPADSFYIVREGRLKMTNYAESGREFVQGYFNRGQSFGEPPFFTRMPYPASAVAVTNSIIWKIHRNDFIALLRDHFEIHLKLSEVLSERLVYKSMMLNEAAVGESEHRLAMLMNYLRKSSGAAKGKDFRIPYTRQQLADMTGLRVETVIRAIKAMEAKGKLSIIEGDIHF